MKYPILPRFLPPERVCGLKSQLDLAISTVLVFKGLITQWADKYVFYIFKPSMYFIFLSLGINCKNGIEEATKYRI